MTDELSAAPDHDLLWHQKVNGPLTVVESFNARTGVVVPVADDYAASQVANDSSVTGASVKAALNALLGAIPSVPVSSVFGRVGAIAATLGDYAASLIVNNSIVPGMTVADALNTLAASIPSVPVSSVFGRVGAIAAAIGDYAASQVSNNSSVSGSSVRDALNTLLAAIPSVPVSSVFGRTGAVVATLGDYAASLVSNNSSVSGATVKDALNTLLAASSPVSSVFGRTGAVVAASGDYAASKITNDATVVGATVAAALPLLRNPVLAPPLVASADDEEFDTDPLNPATPGGSRGWHFAQFISGAWVDATRDGGIDLTQAIAAGHYRSEVRNSTLLLQIPFNETFTLWRTVAGALSTPQIWFAGYGLQFDPSFAGTDWQPFSFQFYKNNAGTPDLNNRSLYRVQANAQRYEVVTIAASVVSTPVSVNQAISLWDGLGVLVDHGTTSGLNFTGFPWKGNLTLGGASRSNAATIAFNAATDKYGLTFRSENLISLYPPVNTAMCAVPFIRRVPAAGGWLAQS